MPAVGGHTDTCNPSHLVMEEQAKVSVQIELK